MSLRGPTVLQKHFIRLQAASSGATKRLYMTLFTYALVLHIRPVNTLKGVDWWRYPLTSKHADIQSKLCEI